MGQHQSQVPAPDELLAPVYPLKWQIAVDFGTSYTGFAIAIKDFVETLNHDAETADLASVPRIHLAHFIKYNSSWPAGPDPYPKTRTALLYDAKGKLVAWGNEAWERFMAMEPDTQAEHIYIDRFKLLLDAKLNHRDAAMDRLKKLGKDVVDVTADYLRELAAFLAKFIEHVDPKTGLNPYHVRWCLTIPTMWTDAAKQKLYRAMFKADLIPSLTSERVVFCSEPMAGLLSEALSSDSRTQVQRNDPTLVVDMGGGTVDLTAMRMGSDGFEELVPGIGATCGSTKLDDAFLAMFRCAVGPEIFDQATEEHPKTKLKVLHEWETCKKTFSGEKKFYGRIPIPRAMTQLLDENDAEFLPQPLGQDDDEIAEVEFDDGELCVTTALMEALYEPIVGQIVQLVTTMLDRLQAKGIAVAHILCVGGFSQSKYLISTLRERLPINPLKIVPSGHAPAAVLLGAPIFACRPEIIRKQVARLTYGIATRTIYAPSIHGPRDRLADRLVMCDDGLTRVENALDVVLRKGDALVPGQCMERPYQSAGCTQEVVDIGIVVSHLEDPVFADTVGCEKVGKVSIKVTPCMHYSRKDTLLAVVRVEHAGLVLEVTNKRTGAKVDLTVDFYD
ncbi:hypothetical protein AMAG_12982 [Allomyces macrogynus ATCC 38327]|uniref:Hsp70-like protein n=1 Tax=Allomyces macrogynus (strain ATCC 38327) TaxID=578462 RepID=A0A0L0T0K5_ALLM3|nr:hypothetical protein AMAG_12982 [Allomyces macrogynus ATCC 38327]|eukprot:KNE68318.1 hypothetical protein AMAG_12982 [Allomyces macrogynus ATCC 38327]